MRWALARLEASEWDLVDFNQQARVMVGLPTGVEVRFMGQSLAAAFCDPPTSHDRRQIALVVLLCQTQAGKPVPVIEARRRPESIGGRQDLVKLLRLPPKMRLRSALPT